MSDNKILFSKIAFEMKKKYQDLDINNYEKYLYLVYGGLAEISDIDVSAVKEIINIEENMIRAGFSDSNTNIKTACDLIKRYSDIAFFMAKKSYFDNDNINFVLPNKLKEIVKSLYESDYLTAEQKKSLRTLISEIYLDFSYAAGKHSVSSIRMSYIIQSTDTL